MHPSERVGCCVGGLLLDAPEISADVGVAPVGHWVSLDNEPDRSVVLVYRMRVNCYSTTKRKWNTNVCGVAAECALEWCDLSGFVVVILPGLMDEIWGQGFRDFCLFLIDEPEESNKSLFPFEFKKKL